MKITASTKRIIAAMRAVLLAWLNSMAFFFLSSPEPWMCRDQLWRESDTLSATIAIARPTQLACIFVASFLRWPASHPALSCFNNYTTSVPIAVSGFLTFLIFIGGV
jgi:hypothetical protein